MLFDLRGRGRRRTVKAVYITLAFLMGGGLVLFGIGGNTSGGLVDAITGAPTSDTGEERFEKQEADALRRLQRNDQDARAYIDLTRARIQLAGTGDRYDANQNTYTDEGLQYLRKAAESWTDLQALDTKLSGELRDEQASLASRMVQAYTALNDLPNAVAAQEIVAETRDTAGTYSTLAVLAYQAGQTRKGDLAGRRALDLTDSDLRASLRAQLDQAKQQASTGAAQGAAGAAQPSG